MKSIIILACVLVAVAIAAPAEEPPKILRSEYDQQPNGAYNFGFDTENGIERNENGELKQVVDEENKPHEVVVVRGSYSYTDSEGQKHTINYSADENGFQAQGDDIPQVPAARR